MQALRLTWKTLVIVAGLPLSMVTTEARAACNPNWLNGQWRTFYSVQGLWEDCSINIFQQGRALSGNCRGNQPSGPAWFYPLDGGSLSMSPTTCNIIGTVTGGGETARVRAAMDRNGSVISGVLLFDNTAAGASFTGIKVNP